MGLGDPPQNGDPMGGLVGEERPPLYRENPLGWGGTPKTGTLWEGEQNGVGASPKNGEPYGDLGGIWGLCGAQWGSGGCGALTTSRKKSTWGRLCTKNLTGCLSMTTFGGAKGGQLPHGDPPPYFINAPQPI